jgi:hypothetical protein
VGGPGRTAVEKRTDRKASGSSGLRESELDSEVAWRPVTAAPLPRRPKRLARPLCRIRVKLFTHPAAGHLEEVLLRVAPDLPIKHWSNTLVKHWSNTGHIYESS